MTRNEIINKIESIAHQTVLAHGYHFSHEAEIQLHEMIVSAIHNNMSDADCRNDRRIALAQENMGKLCRHLCERAARENKVIVENRNFSEARLSICPIWPFC